MPSMSSTRACETAPPAATGSPTGDSNASSRTRAPAAQRVLRWLAYAIVLLAVFLVHRPVLTARALIFDDGLYLFSNPVLMHPTGAGAWQVLSEVLHSS